MSTAKRPAPDGKASASKRQDTGARKDAVKNPSDQITPKFEPGAYRLVTKLKQHITGHVQYDTWPAIILDEEMRTFLLMGKREPATAKDAYLYPGFFRETKVSEKAKVVPVQLLGNNLAMFVPFPVLVPLTKSAIAIVMNDVNAPATLRDAYSEVSEDHDLDYWKERMKGNPQPPADNNIDMGSANEDDSENESEMDEDLPRRTSPPADEMVDGKASLPPSEDTIMDDAPSARLEVQDEKGDKIHGAAEVKNEIASKQLKDSAGHDPQAMQTIFGGSMNGALPTESERSAPEIDAKQVSTGADDVEDVRLGAELHPNGQGQAIKIEPKSNLELSIKERAEARQRNAARKANDDEVRITVGGGEDFIVKRSGVVQSAYLVTKIEYDAEDQENHLCSHKFNRIDPEVFEAVAEFMNTDDYKPYIVNSSQGRTLKDFDKGDCSLARTLVIQSTNLCKLAANLEMAKLRHLAIEKFKLLAPYSPKDFLTFLSIMQSQDFCNDEELERWILQYAASHFYELLSAEGRLKAFMQQAPQVAKKIFRLLAGLPAEEPETPATTPKKPRPRNTAANRTKGSEQPKETPARMPTASKGQNQPTPGPKSTAAKASMPPSAKQNAAKKPDPVAKQKENKKTELAAAAKKFSASAKASKAAPVKNGGLSEASDNDDDPTSDDGSKIAGRPDTAQTEVKKPANAANATKKPASEPTKGPANKDTKASASAKGKAKPKDSVAADTHSKLEAETPKPRATRSRVSTGVPTATPKPDDGNIGMKQTLFKKKKEEGTTPTSKSGAATKGSNKQSKAAGLLTPKPSPKPSPENLVDQLAGTIEAAAGATAKAKKSSAKAQKIPEVLMVPMSSTVEVGDEIVSEEENDDIDEDEAGGD